MGVIINGIWCKKIEFSENKPLQLGKGDYLFLESVKVECVLTIP